MEARAAYERMRERLEAQGPHKIYQAWKRINVDGQRPTEMRYKIYGLDEIIGPETAVLDLGCNVGFMSLKCAERARVVHGVDRYAHWIEIAHLASQAVEAENAFFWNCDARSFEDEVEPGLEMEFDLILALSFHHWNEETFVRYAEEVFRGMLRIGGYFLFESHKLGPREPFDFYSEILQTMGFELIREGETQCPTNYPRPNPLRKWHLLKLKSK